MILTDTKTTENRRFQSHFFAFALFLQLVTNSQADDDCGEKLSTYIIGGEDAEEGAWPWQATLLYLNQWDGSYRHVCGATLIHRKWVITAAHCLDPILNQDEGRSKPSQYLIVLGEHDLTALSGNEQLIPASKLILHPSWTPSIHNGLPADVALVELEREADTRGRHVGTICLPKSSAQYDSAPCWLTGWGIAEDTRSSPSDVLQQGLSHVISNSVCSHQVEQYGIPILPSHICSDGQNTPTACKGDSGGPLSCGMVTPGGAIRFHLAGVYSWSIECTTFPSIFTRVSSYLDWIYLHIGT